MNNKEWQPGDVVPKTSNYTAYDKKGHCGGSGRFQKGDRFPPTQHSGSYYIEEL